MPGGVTSITISGQGGITVERNGNAFTIGLDEDAIPDFTQVLAEAHRANMRLDAGVVASTVAIKDVADTLHPMPIDFTNANFEILLLQMKTLSGALAAMLHAIEE